MTKGTKSNPTMTIQLKTDLFERIVKARGWNSDAAIAKALGISRAQIQRIRSGEQPPSTSFIASFLNAVPEAGFRRTFDIVPATEEEGTQ